MPDTHVTIAGNLTSDPELTITNSGAAVANFRVAVTPRVRDGNTWRDGDTSFYRVTCWRDLATNVTDSLSKGDRVLVVGQLRMRSWESPEGEQRSVVEVTADEVGPSLKWATARPERATRKPTGEASGKGEFADEPNF
jgi:single-strand DNA-binding protein